MMSSREESGEFRTARLGQTLGAQHETIANRLRELAGAGTGETVALIVMTLTGSRRVRLQLCGARLGTAGYFDLHPRELRVTSFVKSASSAI